MAGYSGTPLIQKLGLREGGRLLLIGAPAGFESALGNLPAAAGATRRAAPGRLFDVIILFAPRAEKLAERFAAAAGRLTQSGGLWVAWPKKSSGVKTNITESMVQELGLAAGLVDNKVCAIDEVWSGLRFVIRVRNRSKA